MLAHVTSESISLYQSRRICVQVHKTVESGENSVGNESLKIPD